MSNKLTEFYQEIVIEAEKIGSEAAAEGKKLEAAIEPKLLAFIQLMKPLYNQAVEILTTDVANAVKAGLPAVVAKLTTAGVEEAGKTALDYVLGVAPGIALQVATGFAQSLLALAQSSLPAGTVAVAGSPSPAAQ